MLKGLVSSNPFDMSGYEKKLEGIKQTVESVDKIRIDNYSFDNNLEKSVLKNWQKLKELLGVK